MLGRSTKRNSEQSQTNIINTLMKVLVLLIIIILPIFSFILKNTNLKENEKKLLGEKLLNAMYTFDSAYDLDSQMAVIKELVTADVYNDLTIDNEQRTLTTYFRFKDVPCRVNIICSTPDYILYSLDSVVMEPSREFILLYRVNDDGFIDWIKEAEIIEFRDTIY